MHDDIDKAAFFEMLKEEDAAEKRFNDILKEEDDIVTLLIELELLEENKGE